MAARPVTAVLKEIAFLTDSAASLVANPATTKSYVRLIVLHNTHVAALVVDLYNVPDAAGSLGAAADANKIYSQSLNADETVFLEFAAPGLMLVDENDSIQGLAGTTSLVTVAITGFTESTA